MKRRKFIQSSIVASTIPLAASGKRNDSTEDLQKELYELRTYELKFAGYHQLLIDYLKTALQPALKKIGVNHFMLFEELGNAEPKKMWVLINYPNANIYLQSQNLSEDSVYQTAAKKYNDWGPEQPVYNRFSSSLLLAFDGLPKMLNPIEGANLFELRTYEGYSEDAVRRKIKMFNVEEIELFYKTKLNPIFFGEMIAGPHRPCLTYLLNFKDMEERDANWNDFVQHPEWKRMSAEKKYANSVSNIRKTFLKPM